MSQSRLKRKRKQWLIDRKYDMSELNKNGMGQISDDYYLGWEHDENNPIRKGR